MKNLVAGFLLLLSSQTLAAAITSPLPINALKYLPVLKKEVTEEWPSFTPKSALAAQVEQETCVSLKSKRCWATTTELKTSREYGFGIGQITIAYDSKGKERFNNFTYIKSLDKDLDSWKWEDRFDPEYQFKALVTYDRFIYNRLKFKTKDDYEKTAFTFAAYNGGVGGVLQDRKLCSNTAGCDPQAWFSNVEKTSLKNKIKVKGYGKSFFEINREYVQNIMCTRRQKYIEYLGD